MLCMGGRAPNHVTWRELLTFCFCSGCGTEVSQGRFSARETVRAPPASRMRQFMARKWLCHAPRLRFTCLPSGLVDFRRLEEFSREAATRHLSSGGRT